MKFSILLPTALHAVAVSAVASNFNPRAYPERNIFCPAVDRSDGESEKNVDIRISYIESQPSKPPKATLLMVHGWPGLWSVWARQIQHFSDDYHILAPNIRGFGKSGHPGDVHSSGTYEDFVSDLTCTLDSAGVEKAICVGHDWGSQICYEAARQRPDRITAVVGAVVPYLHAAGPFIPTAYLAKMAPKLAYQAYISANHAEATRELDADMRLSLRAIFRSAKNPPPAEFLAKTDTMHLESYGDAEIEPIVFMSQEEEDYLVEQYSFQGFSRTLQFYLDKNRKLSHDFASSQGNFTITCPVLAILPTKDSVANWKNAMKMIGSEKFIPNLTVREIAAAHNPQLEGFEEFNEMVEEFLNNLPQAEALTSEESTIRDEL